MRTSRLMSGAAGAALAGALVTGGCVSAAVRAPAAGGGASAAARAAAPAAGGTVRFTAYSNDDLPGATVLLSGAIGDYGTAVSVYRSGAIDPEHNSELNLALTQGSFRLSIAALDRNIVTAFTHFKPDPRTCSGHLFATGTAPVVAGSGTGRYQGITGSFRMTVQVNEIDVKAQCRPHPASGGSGGSGGPRAGGGSGAASGLLAQFLVIAGSGTVSFG